MSATLGGLLKDYRLQYNISQLEVALALCWKETSRLSRIEQGKIFKPTRELLERIMDAMKLKEEEKNQLLYIGNYLPTRKEIEKIQKFTLPMIEKWPYPATVFDFTERVILNNQVLFKLYKVNKKQQKDIHKYNPYLLELIYDPNFILNKNKNKKFIQNRREYLREDLAHYIFEQKSRQKDKWFLDLIKKMTNNSLFLAVWEEVTQSKKPTCPITLPIKEAFNPDTDLRLNTYLFKVILNLDPRFFILFYIPTDKETLK